jgi:peroxiredoxin Q/BCP
MEVCSLRDAAKDFEALKVRVFGISLDDVPTQLSFHRAQKLDFDLLSDAEGIVASKYGVLREGRPFASRVTFLIDSKGVIRLVDDEVKVRTHGKDLVERVRKLRGAEPEPAKGREDPERGGER